MTALERIDIIRKAHAKVIAERLATEGGSIEELLPATQEDVLDEAQHLDALDHEEKVDFDADENEVDMDSISPAMREAFA